MEKKKRGGLSQALYTLYKTRKKKKGEGACVCVYSNAESNRGPFANSISFRFEREKDYLFFNVKRT